MTGRAGGPLDRLLRFVLEARLVVFLGLLLLVGWGVLVAPFPWDIGGVTRDPVPVDAIPDTSANQQIVFTEWPGRSPQDVDDQVAYPLTLALLGLSGVDTVRTRTAFGFCSIYVIFEDGVDFYWARSRILEQLSSLPRGLLPEGVTPTLGPDATALGQVFWYTLEGRDEAGRPTGGWDLDELRTAQDFYVRYALQGVKGVAEVASIGGFVKEYQVDVDPDALQRHGVTLEQVFHAVRASNRDIGARTLEINRAEYLVRGLGRLRSVEDLEQCVVAVRDRVPILVRHVARVGTGPALRRGLLDRGGAEAVGGVVVARFGENPMAVLERVHARLDEIAPGMPSKVLDDGRLSRLAVVPFYDRTGLIQETLATLEEALTQEVLVTVIVVLVMLAHLRSALLVSALVPIAVLLSFIGMKVFGVDANVIALAGIAIAIGTMVDMGIVITESILRRQERATTDEEHAGAVLAGTREVGSAVLTAVLTTVISFLPVLTMQGSEGKLFSPLAWTKTFALLASIFTALVLLPPFARVLLGRRRRARAAAAEAADGATGSGPLGRGFWLRRRLALVLAVPATWVLSREWQPFGHGAGLQNLVFVAVVIYGVLFGFLLFQWLYIPLLRVALRHKALFLLLPAGLVVLGLRAWQGLDRELMPRLDEGSFLLMPVTADHASIGEAQALIARQDQAVRAVPEVRSVVGKIGRVESSLDPAPVSMVETVIDYLPEYRLDARGHVARFRFDEERHAYVRDPAGELVPDPDGRPYRQWRPEVRTEQDIWDAVAEAAAIPGMTRASRLHPIETRRVMLESGIKGTLGVKVFGPDLATIERVSLRLEALLRQVPELEDNVQADRQIAKPYLEIDIDRAAIARFGLTVERVQEVLEVAVGGKTLTTTIEGRERYPVRVRYPRELRDSPESLQRILVAAPDGTQVPLGQLAEVRYTPGPAGIQSENGFLMGLIFVSAREGVGEVDAVEAARRHLERAEAEGRLRIPAGVSYRFAGTYENQVRAAERLRIVLPVALFLIFVILYLQFRSTVQSLIVFSGVFVAWAGGFILLGLYGEPWFLDLSLFGTSMRDLFQVHPVNLSIAVWVGFLALFGVATDDGVLMGTFIRQQLRERPPRTRAELHEAVLEAGRRRIRPCLMTTATTVLALLPVLGASGRGAEVMGPMALPTVGGMVVAQLTVFVVPVLTCLVEEWRLRLRPGT